MNHSSIASYDDLDITSADRSLIEDDEHLFYIVTAASFIESGTDLYTKNLLELFCDDAEVSSWLSSSWEPEELRHGSVLQAYVKHVWSEFDWEKAYSHFITDYSKICNQEDLESSKQLELAARCVVEMGTSTYYEAIRNLTTEKVLQDICTLIRNDEIRHYKYFYRFFRRYQADEGNGRISVLSTLASRFVEIRNTDALYAIQHIVNARNPGLTNDAEQAQAIAKSISRALLKAYPVKRAVKMLLRPLDLPPIINRAIIPIASKVPDFIF